MKQISILIVDDSQIHLEGLKMVLKKDSMLRIVGEAHNTKEVMEKIPLLCPDIILLDICLEKQYDGIAITRELTKSHPEIFIIILSHNKDKYSIVNSIRSGARAYLSKDSSTEELIQSIHTVAQGKGLFLGETIPRETLCEYFEDADSLSSVKSYHLSEREIEVIEYLSKGYSTKEIANILNITPPTVDSHKEHIKEKLNQNTVIDIVMFAVRNKLISID